MRVPVTEPRLQGLAAGIAFAVSLYTVQAASAAGPRPERVPSPIRADRLSHLRDAAPVLLVRRDRSKAEEERAKARAKAIEEREKARAKSIEERGKARAKAIEEAGKRGSKADEERAKAHAKAVEERARARAKAVEERGKARSKAIEERGNASLVGSEKTSHCELPTRLRWRETDSNFSAPPHVGGRTASR